MEHSQTSPCLLCGQTKLSLLHNRGRGGKKVENFICENCGFVFILPRPDWSQHSDAYRAGGFSANARQSDKPTYQKLRQTEEQAAARFKLLAGYIGARIRPQTGPDGRPKALEIGCGAGSLLRYLSAAGWETLGIEPDATYTENIRERFGLKIENCFLEDFNASSTFDLIASFHVIEHVDSPDAFLGKCRKLLSDDGILLLECPAIDRIYGPTKDFFFWDVHINTFSFKTLTAFLAKNGFEVTHHAWNGNFINLMARKSAGPLSPESFFDQPSRIKSRVAGYDNSRWKRKLRQRFDKFYKARNRLKNGIVDLVYPFADAAYDFISRRKKYTLAPLIPPKNGLSLTHVAFIGHYNAGDTLLPVVLRDLYDQQMGRSVWTQQHVHKVVDRKTLDRINARDGLVIGGGGLFLRDTNPNQLSGWQWSCSLDTLEKIKVPISVFAVGYNRFRGQPDFAPVFREHLQLLAEKSVFIGLRNSGSIEQVKTYLPSGLHHKLRFQPCMTTLVSRLYSEKAKRSIDVPPFIALNCAFDRPQFRYGEKMGLLLTELARAVKAVSRIAPIHYYAHHPDDEHFLPFLEALEVDYKLERLYKRPPAIVLEAYRKPLLVLGMRGHAQLIPFGCERPIISVVSHNKLQYFLDDIQAPHWGIDINQPNLPDMLFHKVEQMILNLEACEQEVREKQDRLWDITIQNLEEIKKSYGA